MKLLGVNVELLGLRAGVNLDADGTSGKALKSGARRVAGGIQRVAHAAAERLADATEPEAEGQGQSCFEPPAAGTTQE